MYKNKKRKFSLKESLGQYLRPFKKDIPHKKLTLKSLHPDNLAWGIDNDPYDFDPFPDLTKAMEKGGWDEGFKHIKRKIRKTRKTV